MVSVSSSTSESDSESDGISSDDDFDNSVDNNNRFFKMKRRNYLLKSEPKTQRFIFIIFFIIIESLNSLIFEKNLKNKKLKI